MVVVVAAEGGTQGVCYTLTDVLFACNCLKNVL